MKNVGVIQPNYEKSQVYKLFGDYFFRQCLKRYEDCMDTTWKMKDSIIFQKHFKIL